MIIFRSKGYACKKSSFLTIISHLGPTHLRVSASLGESLWQTGPPYLPILNYWTSLKCELLVLELAQCLANRHAYSVNTECTTL